MESISRITPSFCRPILLCLDTVIPQMITQQGHHVIVRPVSQVELVRYQSCLDWVVLLVSNGAHRVLTVVIETVVVPGTSRDLRCSVTATAAVSYIQSALSSGCNAAFI